jgi:DNA-binding LacI/PurR family transcriptional regulator
MPRATLAAVAREAAVSRQTVSNALNAPERVRPETRDRVLQAVARLGYRPHRAAQTLRTRRSQTVGARIERLAEGVQGVVLVRFLHALTARAQLQGYRVLLFAAEDDERETAAYAELLDDHDLDAFVLTGTHLGDARTAWLTAHDVPFVTFGRPWGSVAADHAWVDVDGAAGTRAATEHLVSTGHRRIAFLGWPMGSGAGDDRRTGWHRACAAAGLAVADLEVAALDGLETGRAAAAALLARPEPPTALVCVSDSLALGAWTEITARGLEPGRDVAVIGFDDSPAAAVVGLSSVSQPLEAAAETSLDLLREVLAGSARPPAPRSVLLTPRLALRRSG